MFFPHQIVRIFSSDMLGAPRLDMQTGTNHSLQYSEACREKRARETNLTPCALSAHRQAERMAPTTVGTSLLQALDVIQNLSAQIILNLHVGEDGGQVENLLVGQLTDAAGRVDVEAGQEARGGVVADSEEGLERFLHVDTCQLAVYLGVAE